MKKTVIALKGIGGQGKSETIKRLRNLIKSTYTHHVENILIDKGDVKVIIEIKGVKIGIESQGDPDSRQEKSISEFVSKNCDIIICASRTRGETVDTVFNTKKDGYRVIWVTNYRSKEISHSELNNLSAKHLLELINQIMSSII